MVIKGSFDPATGTEVGDTPANKTARRILVLASATCLVAVVTASLPQPARARSITTPPVPFDLRVDLATNEAFLEGHAEAAALGAAVTSPAYGGSSLNGPQLTGIALQSLASNQPVVIAVTLPSSETVDLRPQAAH